MYDPWERQAPLRIVLLVEFPHKKHWQLITFMSKRVVRTLICNRPTSYNTTESNSPIIAGIAYIYGWAVRICISTGTVPRDKTRDKNNETCTEILRLMSATTSVLGQPQQTKNYYDTIWTSTEMALHTHSYNRVTDSSVACGGLVQDEQIASVAANYLL